MLEKLWLTYKIDIYITCYIFTETTGLKMINDSLNDKLNWCNILFVGLDYRLYILIHNVKINNVEYLIIDCRTENL